MVKTMPQAINLLITGVDVVTFDDPGTVVLGGAIAIKGNTIAWIGPVSEASRFIAADTIPGKGMIAMPGLIDGHYHTGQQLLRGKLASMKDREFLTVDMEPMRRRMAKEYKVILDRYDRAIA
jgi:5-methylthioadenosine/S-adenosylhomocysteine deaminase